MPGQSTGQVGRYGLTASSSARALPCQWRLLLPEAAPPAQRQGSRPGKQQGQDRETECRRS